MVKHVMTKKQQFCGHCPGNQGHQGKVSESEEGLKWSEKSQAI